MKHPSEVTEAVWLLCDMFIATIPHTSEVDMLVSTNFKPSNPQRTCPCETVATRSISPWIVVSQRATVGSLSRAGTSREVALPAPSEWNKALRVAADLLGERKVGVLPLTTSRSSSMMLPLAYTCVLVHSATTPKRITPLKDIWAHGEVSRPAAVDPAVDTIWRVGFTSGGTLTKCSCPSGF
jgi:hypothetical protein